MKEDDFLRTTINFELNRYELLEKKCFDEGVCIKEIIRKCLYLYIDDMKKDDFEKGTISYQDDAVEWKKLHFTLSDEEYDTFADVKKIQRLSFSFIVAIAIDTYADSVLSGMQNYSYPPKSYTKFYIVVNNYTSYRFVWGKLDKIELTDPKLC
jgi:hypothetical protein